jgi:hypothetical protein
MQLKTFINSLLLPRLRMDLIALQAWDCLGLNSTALDCLGLYSIVLPGTDCYSGVLLTEYYKGRRVRVPDCM